jgi:hypothetical protein
MQFETDTPRAKAEAKKKGWTERVYFEVLVYRGQGYRLNEYFCPASLVAYLPNNM